MFSILNPTAVIAKSRESLNSGLLSLHKVVYKRCRNASNLCSALRMASLCACTKIACSACYFSSKCKVFTVFCLYKIYTFIDGNPINPGRKCGFILKILQSLMHSHKSILRDFLRVFVALKILQRKIENHFFVAMIHCFKYQNQCFSIFTVFAPFSVCTVTK
jgi:hypothetical protein